MTHVHIISIKVGAGNKIAILSAQSADVTFDLFCEPTSVHPKIMTDEINSSF